MIQHQQCLGCDHILARTFIFENSHLPGLWVENIGSITRMGEQRNN